jgi:hypothetical protein
VQTRHMDAAPPPGQEVSDAQGADQAAPFDWRKHLPVHPAADLFPLMSEVEPKELAADINVNGLQASIPKERAFIENIVERSAPLSEKQRKWLYDIVDRLEAA